MMPRQRRTASFALLVLGAAACVAVALANRTARGDVYAQDTEATIGNITSQTVATLPANRARTTVGIGEEVTCSIDPNTWADSDCNVTQNRKENDTLGSINWSISVGTGAVAPTTGNSTTFTASKSPGAATVKATVVDSGTKFDDVVVKTKPFDVIAPTGATAAYDQDISPWAAGANFIGMDQRFICTVQPTTVNFYNAQFRQDQPGDTWTWPDNTPDSYTATRITFSATTIGGSHNRWYQHSWSHYPVARIANQNFSYTLRIDLQYQNAAATWVSFKPDFNSVHRFTGADKKGRIELNGTNGVYVGPWNN